ncbi:hypothetical protein OG582_39630 (plasmid) [Streptomyces anulatus]|uniref:hypothetical protein n=1 Tax=Streptomyces anulatus TaxID=1892 RepID=UPI003245AD5B
MAYALVAGFPTRLVGDVQSVLAVMPEARLAPMMSFEVEVSANYPDSPSRAQPSATSSGSSSFGIRPSAPARNGAW